MGDLVLWEKLSRQIHVLFSTLCDTEERYGFDEEVAILKLPNNIFLDIEWRGDSRSYILRVFDDEYMANRIAPPSFHTSVQDLLQAVRDWVIRCGGAIACLPSSSATLAPPTPSQTPFPRGVSMGSASRNVLERVA